MSKSLVIKAPIDGATISSHHDVGGTERIFFVASGRAEKHVVAVSGKCASANDSVDGVLVGFRWHEKGKHHLWHMLFQVDQAQVATDPNYTIFMEGADATGAIADGDSVDVLLENTYDLTTIASPGPNEDISGELDDFTAYGDLQAPITTFSMRYPYPYPTHSVAVLNLYQDYTDQCIWFAQFETLPAGKTFVLTVIDTVPTSLSVHPHT
jgi:hypothetical protein